MMTYNQMSIHTTPGCTDNGSEYQLGISGPTTDCSQPPGCTVMETSPNSYAGDFAAAGGGVWATQFDVSGILYVVARVASLPSLWLTITCSIWFWSVRRTPGFDKYCDVLTYFLAPQHTCFHQSS